MFEDAFVTRDADALSAIFVDGAVLAARAGGREARGVEAIERFASALWASDTIYLAAPCRVVQARDTALVLGRQGVNVVCRGADGDWRYAIALLSAPDTKPKEEFR